MWPSLFGTLANVQLLCCQATDETAEVCVLNEKPSRPTSSGLCPSNTQASPAPSDHRKGRRVTFWFLATNSDWDVENPLRTTLTRLPKGEIKLGQKVLFQNNLFAYNWNEDRFICL